MVRGQGTKGSTPRAVLLAVALAVGLDGCSHEVEETMPTEGRAPWILWGQTTSMPVLGGAPGVIPRSTQQLTQIRYGRPESWRFFLQAKVVQVNGSAGNALFFLNWNLTFGLGRGTTSLKQFCQMSWTPVEFVTGSTAIRAVTSVELPQENAGRLSDNVIDTLTFETLQVDVDGSFDAANTVAAGSMIELTSFWAPVTHIRPEWYLAPTSEGASDAGSPFPGDEHKGH